MSTIDYKELLKGKEYDFLRYNGFLGDNILLLALGGSRAYGTDLPSSDVDIRGFAVNPSRQIYGLEKDFEQVVDTDTDTTIYSLNKMAGLLLACNPNTLEILGCRPEDYLYVTPYGQKVLDNKANFLSTRAIDTFGGYARTQFNRLESALLGNGHNENKRNAMFMHSMQSALDAFNAKHKNDPAKLTISQLPKDEYQARIKARYQAREADENLKFESSIGQVYMDDSIKPEDKESKIQSLKDLHLEHRRSCRLPICRK